jgi:hypothetical protein
MQPFAPRPIRFIRIDDSSGWKIKLYSVVYGDGAFNESDFLTGLNLAREALPQPAVTESRPGVGFCVLHRGNGADYTVLGWWDRENELPTRIFVRPHNEQDWRPAQGSESFCVWDLQVIGFERDAYVATVLARPPLGSEAYLKRVMRDA